MAQMTTGLELATFITGLNGDATIDSTLLEVLIDQAKAVLEEERPWMVLRKTDTSKSITTANTWQTAIDLSTITRFSRFYGEFPVKLFDGTNRTENYLLVPFDRRLEFKDVSNTACYDENSKNLYLNGTVPFNGSLYISHIIESTHIDPTATTAVWTEFSARWLPVLAFYAVGVYKGGVDYDSINRAMLPANSAAFQALKNAMEKWDNEKQLSSIQFNDPTDPYFPRGGAIDRSA